MRTATINIDESKVQVLSDGKEFFRIEPVTFQRSVQKPLLDEFGNQVFNDLSETEKAPAFFFELVSFRVPKKEKIELTPEQIQEFEQNAVELTEKDVEELFTPVEL